MKGDAPVQAADRGDLVVVLTCEACGKEIRLVAGHFGPEIEDTDTFLALHGDCLNARGPQRAIAVSVPPQRTS